MANIDLVILDLDGTLYSSTATTLGAVERAVHDLNERHGDVAAFPSDDLVLSGGRVPDATFDPSITTIRTFQWLAPFALQLSSMAGTPQATPTKS